MKTRQITVLLAFILFCSNHTLSQSFSNWRQYSITSDTIISESQIVVPETIILLPTSNHIQVEVKNHEIHISGLKSSDSLTLSYRVFNHVFSEKSASWKEVETGVFFPKEIKGKSKYQLIDRKGLDYQGSFGRAIQVGNHQSLLLNSNFNMQLSGNIGDNIEVLGAISDNNIPIQPDGDTRRLDEFDKVFIQISKDAHKIRAGDYQINTPSGYYLQYIKKLSGIQYGYRDTIAKKWIATGETGFAAARGKFARNTLKPQEGNQGPYQLKGNEGERFLVILAGTEKVYWDGDLLVRGADYDYVIDYNQAQITFSYKKLVNSNIRIIVEFEYIERNYGRSVLTANAQFSNGKLDFYLNGYQHRDSKNPSGNLLLDSTALARLNTIGDNLENAFVDGSRMANREELSDRILYISKDTSFIVNGIKRDTSIFVYHEFPNENDARIVRFTPADQGSYDLVNTNTNGRIYKWVAPDSISGLFTGSYDAIIRLSAPEELRILTMGSKAQLNKNLVLESEMIISQKDLNRLSNHDDHDNTGLGGYAQLSYVLPLSKMWDVKATARNEVIQQRLRHISPFRNAEFSRDWNIKDINKQNEHLQTYGLAFIKNKKEIIEWKSDVLKRKDHYNASKHSVNLNIDFLSWNISSKSSLLDLTHDMEEGRFFRPQLQLKKSWNNLKNIEIGGEVIREDNQRKINGILTQESFRFDKWSTWLQGPRGKKWNSKALFTQRTDYLVDSLTMKRASKATDITVTSEIKLRKNITFQFDARWRNFVVSNPSKLNAEDQKTLLIRFNQRASLWENTLDILSHYEIGSGQEPLIEYVFEERRPGEGRYIYDDLNHDGIRQVNEYIAAPFVDTARYVRIQLLNSEFTTTRNLIFSQNIKFSPGKLLSKKAPDWTKRLMWSSTIKTISKSRGDLEYSPYITQNNDSLNITFHSIMQHHLFINRGHPTFDLQLGLRRTSNLNNLISGSEERTSSSYFIKSRYNLWSTSEIILKSDFSNRTSNSQFFKERQYNINALHIELDWNVVIRKKLRIITGYDYKQKINASRFGGEDVDQNGVHIELSYRRAQDYSIRIKGGFTTVEFEDKGNQSLNYVLLEELREGKNYEWMVQWDKLIFTNIQMSVNYKGRKNGIGNIIHTGQASFKANF